MPPAPQQFVAGRTPNRFPVVLLFAVSALTVLSADLIFKAWSFAHVADRPVVLDQQSSRDPLFWQRYARDPIVLVPHVLSLHLTINTGAVFGLGKSGLWAFIAVSIAAAIALPIISYRSRRTAWPLHLALGLILGGALGNLYDRVRFHAVRDMLWLFPGVKLPWGLAWPSGSAELYPWLFNIADAALLLGVGLVVLVTWRTPEKKTPPRA